MDRYGHEVFKPLIEMDLKEVEDRFVRSLIEEMSLIDRDTFNKAASKKYAEREFYHGE